MYIVWLLLAPSRIVWWPMTAGARGSCAIMAASSPARIDSTQVIATAQQFCYLSPDNTVLYTPTPHSVQFPPHYSPTPYFRSTLILSLPLAEHSSLYNVLTNIPFIINRLYPNIFYLLNNIKWYVIPTWKCFPSNDTASVWYILTLGTLLYKTLHS